MLLPVAGALEVVVLGVLLELVVVVVWLLELVVVLLELVGAMLELVVVVVGVLLELVGVLLELVVVGGGVVSAGVVVVWLLWLVARTLAMVVPGFLLEPVAGISMAFADAELAVVWRLLDVVAGAPVVLPSRSGFSLAVSASINVSFPVALTLPFSWLLTLVAGPWVVVLATGLMTVLVANTSVDVCARETAVVTAPASGRWVDVPLASHWQSFEAGGMGSAAQCLTSTQSPPSRQCTVRARVQPVDGLADAVGSHGPQSFGRHSAWRAGAGSPAGGTVSWAGASCDERTTGGMSSPAGVRRASPRKVPTCMDLDSAAPAAPAAPDTPLSWCPLRFKLPSTAAEWNSLSTSCRELALIARFCRATSLSCSGSLPSASLRPPGCEPGAAGACQARAPVAAMRNSAAASNAPAATVSRRPPPGGDGSGPLAAYGSEATGTYPQGGTAMPREAMSASPAPQPVEDSCSC